MNETKQNGFSQVPVSTVLKELYEALVKDGIHAGNKLLIEFSKAEELKCPR